jgi:hypothetical protein
LARRPDSGKGKRRREEKDLDEKLVSPAGDGKMSDDLAALNKLSQMSPTGKMKDSKEVLKGKELPRRKKGKKNVPEDSQEAVPAAEEEREEKGTSSPSGQVVDIII